MRPGGAPSLRPGPVRPDCGDDPAVEQMKSAAEAKASGLADKLVPYTFAGSLLSLALTGT